MMIAIVPTACGIETSLQNCSAERLLTAIAIVPTACGIETALRYLNRTCSFVIAIVPTACGIETCHE